MIKTIIIRILRKTINFLVGSVPTPSFKHGKNFHNNGHIDTLNPQFVEIGDNFISAPGSLITAHDASTLLHSKKYRVEKVIIGNNVFLGANSVVLPGVIIEDNVIVGAGSVVNRNLSSNSVYAGNPAKYICSVGEYLNKCEQKNALYTVTDEHFRQFELGLPISQDVIYDYQKRVIKEYHDRQIINE